MERDDDDDDDMMERDAGGGAARAAGRETTPFGYMPLSHIMVCLCVLHVL